MEEIGKFSLISNITHAISLSSCVLFLRRKLMLATTYQEHTELQKGHDGALQESTVACLDIFWIKKMSIFICQHRFFPFNIHCSELCSKGQGEKMKVFVVNNFSESTFPFANDVHTVYCPWLFKVLWLGYTSADFLPKISAAFPIFMSYGWSEKSRAHISCPHTDPGFMVRKILSPGFWLYSDAFLVFPKCVCK